MFFVKHLFCETSLFVECCYKETTTVDKEKVEESELASVEVQVVNDMADVEEEPLKVPPQQVKHLEIAATKTKKSLRLQDQNALATTKKKAKLEAKKIAASKRKNVSWSKWRFLCRRRKKRRRNNQRMQKRLQKRRNHQITSSILPQLKARGVVMIVPLVQSRAKTKIPVSVYPCYVIASSHVHEAHFSILCLNMFV
jgi:hypothetical protein